MIDGQNTDRLPAKRKPKPEAGPVALATDAEAGEGRQDVRQARGADSDEASAPREEAASGSACTSWRPTCGPPRTGTGQGSASPMGYQPSRLPLPGAVASFAGKKVA